MTNGSTIERLPGGPQVAGRPMTYLVNCWCGESHDLDNPADAWEAMRNLGHVILAELRIPELVEWLARKLRSNT